jgi:hypothetical protein
MGVKSGMKKSYPEFSVRMFLDFNIRNTIQQLRDQNLDCGGRAQRRHRFSCGPVASNSGVALRFPPQSKIHGCGTSSVRFIRVHSAWSSFSGIRCSMFNVECFRSFSL